MIWISFIAVAALIIIAGSRLSILADKLAKLLNISSSTIGLLLVSIITSLPELSTSLGAAIKVGQPNLSLGNTLGSDLFNLMIIALCDITCRKKGLLRKCGKKITPVIHYLCMISALVITLTVPNAISVSGFNFNIGSIGIIILYVCIFLSTHKSGTANSKSAVDSEHQIDKPELIKTLSLFALAALVIIISGTILASLGDKIADQTGLEESFVGSLFLALATSLPELTVSFTAVKIGSYGLMLGNIIGSNMFNVFIAAITDVAYHKEALHIPSNISSGLLIIAGCVIVMALLVIAGVKQKKEAKTIAWESVSILLFYLAGLFALYKG